MKDEWELFRREFTGGFRDASGIILCLTIVYAALWCVYGGPL